MFQDPILVVAQDEDGSLLVRLAPVYDEPAVWGIVIADIAKHLANAYGDRGFVPSVTLRKIQEIVITEFNKPTAQAFRVTVDDDGPQS